MTTHEEAMAIDTEIAETLDRLYDAERYLGWAIDSLHRALKDTQEVVRVSRSQTHRVWALSTSQAIEEGQRRAALARSDTDYATFTRDDWANREIAEKLPPVLSQQETKAEISGQLSRLSGLYTGWSRFFLVTNAGGHVHRSRACSTTFPTTQWAWLPQLSGLDEAAAVKDQGPRLCSVCFPSAPTEWTLGLPKAPKCEGSGQRAITKPGRYSRYGQCPVCHKSFAINQTTGAIRAHKPQEV